MVVGWFGERNEEMSSRRREEMLLSVDIDLGNLWTVSPPHQEKKCLVLK